MKKKIFALLVAFAFGVNTAAVAFADVKNKNERQAQSLAALLPASDAVVAFNAQRLVNEALPQILSANQPMLKDILGKIDEVKNKTGVDLRQFEQFALGVSSKRNQAKEFDFEPVVLARGSFNAGALISLAKIALNGKYREEKVGDKIVYIFTPPAPKIVPLNKKTQSNGSASKRALDKMFDKLSREFAVSSYDNNTLAIGTTARVRETLQAKTRVEPEILSLVNRKPNALISFGMTVPNGMSALINLGNDELGKNIDSIRQISGSMDVTEGNAIVSLAAKTLRPEQAQALKETLDGLQMVGKSLLGGAKGADKKVFARMIENARVVNNAGEVTLDLQVPQSDIDILVGMK